ncbi:MAG: TetR/AcrR family transcriptional regulator, partial [Actinomycetota bacterium]|nr:TetR/AcrR family transcriptional regulator [Actinomycetota bacterium]
LRTIAKVIETHRKRATAMRPDDRRAAIVATTLPLIVEHGATVTTGQIAAASGVAEGTVFRVFADKQELLAACLDAAFDPAEPVATLRQIPRHLPVRDRLLRATDTVAEHWDRALSVGHAVHTACTGPSRAGSSGSPGAAMRELISALAELLAPDVTALRLSPERTAQLFLLTVTSDRMLRLRMGGLGAPALGDVEELVDVFLHGALRGEHG